MLAERLAARPGARPDDVAGGCPKGHWRDNPDPTRAVDGIVRLYELQRATAGTCLTRSEQTDRLLGEAFRELGNLDRQWAQAQARKSEQLLSMLVPRS